MGGGVTGGSRDVISVFCFHTSVKFQVRSSERQMHYSQTWRKGCKSVSFPFLLSFFFFSKALSTFSFLSPFNGQPLCQR